MKLKEKILYLGLDPKREFGIIAISNLLLIAAGVLTYVFLKEILYPALCGGALVIFDLVFLTRYSSQIKAKNNENMMDFANIFGYFRVFISNGYSVYSAIKEITNYANPDLQKSLQKLVNDIDNDKSVQPFINFSKQFNEIIIEEMMISIYQLIDDGESSNYLIQFELIFDKFSELLNQKYLKDKDSKLGSISSAPLVGSCFLIIVLTIGIIGIIGELISGI